MGHFEPKNQPSVQPGTGQSRFAVPAARWQVEDTVRRSRFLTTLDRCTGADDTKGLVGELRVQHPGASHHCHAFVAGPPGSTRSVGFSDDGEPRGTAGRPMLEALLHSGVGEIVAVSTRFYGGVKLGTGGLARAYAGGVVQALRDLPTRIVEPTVVVDVAVGYAQVAAAEAAIDRLLGQEAIVRRSFGAGAEFELDVPVRKLRQLREELADATAGDAAISNARPPANDHQPGR